MSAAEPITLSIAGSDSGGGAGIQADIKAISATGGYACTAITALTAQNTRGVSGIHPVPVDFIRRQLDAVFDDLAVAAVKIGMLGDADTIRCVAQALGDHRPAHIVLDPVMVTSNGDLLLAESAIEALESELLPLASVITPNLPEALALLGRPRQPLPQDTGVIGECAEALVREKGVRAALVKGGRQTGEKSVDALATERGTEVLEAPRIDTPNTHGTGCSLSAAIASLLAQGESLDSAVHLAKRYISRAIEAGAGRRIGGGHGPVDHFYDGSVRFR